MAVWASAAIREAVPFAACRGKSLRDERLWSSRARTRRRTRLLTFSELSACVTQCAGAGDQLLPASSGRGGMIRIVAEPRGARRRATGLFWRVAPAARAPLIAHEGATPACSPQSPRALPRSRMNELRFLTVLASISIPLFACSAPPSGAAWRVAAPRTQAPRRARISPGSGDAGAGSDGMSRSEGEPDGAAPTPPGKAARLRCPRRSTAQRWTTSRASATS